MIATPGTGKLFLDAIARQQCCVLCGQELGSGPCSHLYFVRRLLAIVREGIPSICETLSASESKIGSFQLTAQVADQAL